MALNIVSTAGNDLCFANGLLYFVKRNQSETKPKQNKTKPTVVCETKQDH